MCRCIMSSEDGSRNVSKRSVPGWDCSERNAVNRLGVPLGVPLPISSGFYYSLRDYAFGFEGLA
jgi:hypothetical protein